MIIIEIFDTNPFREYPGCRVATMLRIPLCRGKTGTIPFMAGRYPKPNDSREMRPWMLWKATIVPS